MTKIVVSRPKRLAIFGNIRQSLAFKHVGKLATFYSTILGSLCVYQLATSDFFVLNRTKIYNFSIKLNDLQSPATLEGVWDSLSRQFWKKSRSVYNTPPTSDKNRQSAVANRQSLEQSRCVYQGPYCELLYYWTTTVWIITGLSAVLNLCDVLMYMTWNP